MQLCFCVQSFYDTLSHNLFKLTIEAIISNRNCNLWVRTEYCPAKYRNNRRLSPGGPSPFQSAPGEMRAAKHGRLFDGGECMKRSRFTRRGICKMGTGGRVTREGD